MSAPEVPTVRSMRASVVDKPVASPTGGMRNQPATPAVATFDCHTSEPSLASAAEATAAAKCRPELAYRMVTSSVPVSVDSQPVDAAHGVVFPALVGHHHADRLRLLVRRHRR